MNRLFLRQEINFNISLEQFIEDVECLFNILKDSYGLYEYYGDDVFLLAKDKVLADLRGDTLDLERGISALKKYLYAFIQDGHFRIGLNPVSADDAKYDYAVRYSKFHGIDVIDCKKFWYDTDVEHKELDDFVANAEKFKNEEPLIIDLRDNGGGSDTYIWEFLKTLFNCEIGFSRKYVQKNSGLFIEYMRTEWPDFKIEFEPGIEQDVEDASIFETSKSIYVLFNENTCSAGESAIAFLKSISGTTLVGEHSGGCFVCGNCMEIFLPHSHIPVYFGTGICLYEKTRNMDAEGGFKGDISYEEFVRLVTNETSA